jgi:hypothetical protein
MNAPYSISLEILNAILIGTAIFVCGSSVILIVYSLVNYILFGDFLSLVEARGLYFTLMSGLFMTLLVFFWICMWFIGIIVISLLQYATIALPLAKLMSRGVDEDSKRSLIFFVVMGAIVGGGPWCVLTYFTITAPLDVGSAILILAPGLTIGILSGGTLKHRLSLLSSALSIEECIK